MGIAPRTGIGKHDKWVLLQNPGPKVPDATGGYTQSWYDLPPRELAAVEPATAATLERIAAGATVISTATKVVTINYWPEVSTETRVVYEGMRLSVKSIFDEDDGHAELSLVCEEQLQ